MEHIPYKGSGPAQADFIGNQVPLMVDSVTAALANIQAGKAVPLGVTSATRSSQLPNVPTIAESGLPEFAGFEAVGWLGLMAPKGTPKAVVNASRYRFAGLGTCTEGAVSAAVPAEMPADWDIKRRRSMMLPCHLSVWR